MRPTSIIKKTITLLFLFVLLAGFSLRFIYIQDVISNPTLNIFLPKTDMYNLDTMARNLLQPTPLNLKMPTYPALVYLISILYRFFGDQPAGFYWLQLILSLCSVIILVFVGVKIFGFYPGMLSGLFLLYYKMSYYFDGLFIKTSIIQFLLVISIYLYVLLLHRSRFLISLFFVFTSVFLCLLRPFLWIVLIGAILVLIIRHRQFKKPSYCLLYGTLILAAFTFTRLTTPSDQYNYKLSFHLFMGNYPGASGLIPDFPEIPRNAEGFSKNSLLYVCRQAGITRNFDQYWLGRVRDFVLNNPKAMLRLYLRKLNYLFNNFEAGNNSSVYYYAQNTILNRLPQLNFSFIFTLSIVGIFFALLNRHPSRHMLWPVGAIIFMITLLFINSRYRMPVIPFLCLYAGYGLMQIIDAFFKKKYILILAVYLIASLAVFWSNISLPFTDRQLEISKWILNGEKQKKFFNDKQAALKDLSLWRTLNNDEKVEVAERLEWLGLWQEFIKIYPEIRRLSRESMSHTVRLLKREAAMYESSFNFRLAINVWDRLAQFDQERHEAEQTIREFEIIGPLLDKDYYKNTPFILEKR